MLVAAAFCPHPPLLVPLVAAGAAGETAGLRAACRDALGRVVEQGVDDLVVVGSGPASGTARPGERGTLAGFGVDLTVALGDGPDPGEARLPLSLTIGAWLLRESGYDGPARGRVVATTESAEDLLELGERIAAWPGRTGLLVMGDGSFRRSEKAPGYFDPRAEAFDLAVVDALADANVGVLATIDAVAAAELGVTGRAPWQLAAGAARLGTWRGEVLYDAAPYGVQYTVAVWTPGQ